MSNIEIINHFDSGNVEHVLFDFDGTISLIREGWQEVMIPMMVEILMNTPYHESKEELIVIVTDFVTILTGKQTIYQMIRLCEEIEKRGKTPDSPFTYKERYHQLLMDRIRSRIQGLEKGLFSPKDLTVPGTFELLEGLKQIGVKCYLASGTDEKYVLNEAALLNLEKYFEKIYGAQDDYKNFNKKMVIDHIMNENSLLGREFVSFGDGYVEIQDTINANGIAIGVASNEDTREGINGWKRRRLINAGANIIIPDFREHEKIIKLIFEGCYGKD